MQPNHNTRSDRRLIPFNQTHLIGAAMLMSGFVFWGAVLNWWK